VPWWGPAKKGDLVLERRRAKEGKNGVAQVACRAYHVLFYTQDMNSDMFKYKFAEVRPARVAYDGALAPASADYGHQR
jgi:hypothetical protein